MRFFKRPEPGFAVEIIRVVLGDEAHPVYPVFLKALQNCFKQSRSGSRSPFGFKDGHILYIGVAGAVAYSAPDAYYSAVQGGSCKAVTALYKLPEPRGFVFWPPPALGAVKCYNSLKYFGGRIYYKFYS